MRQPLLAAIAGALALHCQPKTPVGERPVDMSRVVLGPQVDPDRTATLLRRYREEHASNRHAIAACERATPDDCRTEGASCEARIAWGDHGMGGPAVCVAPEAIVHAWQQEERRRACVRSDEGLWSVYQQSGEKLYGTCVCPTADLDAVLRDGEVWFHEEAGECLSDRRTCERGGGVFMPARRAAEPSPVLARALEQWRPTDAQACAEGPATVDLETGQFLFARWVEASERCEVAVLVGFVSAGAPHPYDDRPVAPQLETSRCALEDGAR